MRSATYPAVEDAFRQTDAVEIRTRFDDDLTVLVAIAARVHATDNYPICLPDGDEVRFFSRPPPMVAWVAVDGDRLVGHVALNETTSEPVMELVDEYGPRLPAVYVARLLVDPGSRRRGIGRVLLDHACGAALEAGRSAFLDVVDTGTAGPAIALYRSQGWEEIGRARFHLADQEIEHLVFCGPTTDG